MSTVSISEKNYRKKKNIPIIISTKCARLEYVSVVTQSVNKLFGKYYSLAEEENNLVSVKESVATLTVKEELVLNRAVH